MSVLGILTTTEGMVPSRGEATRLAVYYSLEEDCMTPTTKHIVCVSRHPIAAAALLFAACSSNGAGTAASQQDYEQVAQSLAGNASPGGEPATFGVAADLASGLIPVGLSLDASGRFFGEHAGLTYDGTVTCTDLGIAVPAQCGPTTSTAQVTGTWSGQLTLPRVVISGTRSGTWTLSGLQTATVTIEGTAHAELTSQFASASDQNHKQLALTADATYQAVLVDRASRLPVGGDIEYAITGQRTHTTPGLDKTQAISMDATLTFHPDHTATLVIDGDKHFHLDLETGEASSERD